MKRESQGRAMGGSDREGRTVDKEERKEGEIQTRRTEETGKEEGRNKADGIRIKKETLLAGGKKNKGKEE